jgi:hypothetical protein
MFRYKLRTLLIVLALGPVLIAAGWWGWGEYQDWREWRELERQTSELRALQELVYREWASGSASGGLQSLPPSSPAAKLLRDAEAEAPDENRSPLPGQ